MNVLTLRGGRTLLCGFDLRYNILGMVTNVTQTGAGLQPVDRAYAYDSLDRLIGESGTGGPPVGEGGTGFQPVVRSYEYDLVGNRTQATIDGAAETYALGLGNRLATYGAPSSGQYVHGMPWTYDAAGNVTRVARAGQPALDLAWDAQYRLATVSTNGVVLEAYGYDPLGRRAWTESPLPLGEGQGEGAAFARTTYAYDDNWQVVADLDATGAVLRSYTWGPGVDNLLALTTHDGGVTHTYYALTDHLGTVHAFADASGSIAESYAYDAWGNVLAVLDASGTPLPASALGNRYLFQGREYSFATRLYHFRARWYDPQTGRWLSNDPIGISGGINQYVFCGNDPVNYVDPSGLDFIYIIDQTAVRGNGHAAVITGPINGLWRYDSFGKPKGSHRHGQYTFSTERDALDFAIEKGYTYYAKWITSPEQDLEAQNTADKWHAGKGKKYTMHRKYQVDGDNCQSLVDDMADSAGIDLYFPRSAIRHPVLTMEFTKWGADIYGPLQ